MITIKSPILGQGFAKPAKVGVKSASVLLAMIGLTMLAISLVMGDGSLLSRELMISGAGMLSLSILLFYLSPSRYIRSDVCDAMVLSYSSIVSKALATPILGKNGIYIPASNNDTIKVLIPLSSENKQEGAIALQSSPLYTGTTGPYTDGLLLVPPGYELFRYLKRIGAGFTPEGLSADIKNSLENDLELASQVYIDRIEDRISVTMQNMVNAGMCASISKENHTMCSQIGCPVCSLVGCIIVDATHRRAKLESIAIEGKTINLTYELL